MSSKTPHTNQKQWNILSWIFLALAIGSAFLISQIENYNIAFLLLLFALMVGAIYTAKKACNSVLNIARVLLGLLFIYSGFVKGVDPLGTQFRIEDYFYAYGTEWAIPMALVLSVLLNAAEFSLGALLVLRIKMRLVSTLTLLMMLMFTITTLYDALYSPVPDCGCFGDALIISNWQTFYKNLVINSLLLLVFLRRNDFRQYSSKMIEWAGIGAVLAGFILFENYNINNLPVMDFRPWKVGNRLLPENPQPVKYYLTYKNIQTEELQEFLSSDLPWQDSVFMANWKWESSREDDPNIEDMNTFPMVDSQGIDASKQLVGDTNFTFLFSIYNLDKVPLAIIPSINEFATKANEFGYNVVMLSSEIPEDYTKFMLENKLIDMPLYNSDDTSLKAAVRSNPGLIVVKDGVVVAKYHYSDFPVFDSSFIPSFVD